MKELIDAKINIEFQFYYSLSESARNCIRYSTKEDFECMFKNIDSKNFHLNFHIYYWSIETDSFSILDPFIQKNGANVEYIENKYYEFRKINNPKPLYEIFQFKPFNNWRDLVIQWFNDFINKRTSKPLYLFGKPDSGKSYFIFSLFCKFLSKKIIFLILL